MSLTAFLFAALTLVSPHEGETVQTLKPVHRAYLNGPLAERFLRMRNPGDRAKLFAAGATQAPLRLAWSGETNAVYELSVSVDGGEEETLVISNRTDIYVTNLEVGRTYRWIVKRSDTGETASASFVTEAAAPRLLRAGGVHNFRDLGGWTTSDGRRVRQNMIFRSAGLRSSSKSSGGFFRQKVTIGERRVTDEGLEALKDELAGRLAPLGAYAELESVLSFYPEERVTLYVTCRPCLADGLPDDVEPAPSMSILDAVRASFAAMASAPLSSGRMSKARSAQLSRMNASVSDEKMLIDKVLDRYSYGKDTVSGYKNLIQKATPASVQSVFSALIPRMPQP